MKKIFSNIILLLCLLITLIYVTNITAIPSKIVIFNNEILDLKTIFGIYQKKEQIVPTSINTNDNVVKEENIRLRLFNLIDIKDINIKTIKNKEVIPLRQYNRIKIIF